MFFMYLFYYVFFFHSIIFYLQNFNLYLLKHNFLLTGSGGSDRAAVAHSRHLQTETQAEVRLKNSRW